MSATQSWLGALALGATARRLGAIGSFMVAVGGLDAKAALLAPAQALLLHESGDAMTPVAASFFAQGLHHARTAVGVPALGMNQVDFVGQRLVFQRARARTSAALVPVVIAAGGNLQVLAQGQDRILVFHRVDPLGALKDGSERMPSVFFKMSRCSRRCRFSRRAVSNWPCRSASEPGFAPAVAAPPATAGAKPCFQA